MVPRRLEAALQNALVRGSLLPSSKCPTTSRSMDAGAPFVLRTTGSAGVISRPTSVRGPDGSPESRPPAPAPASPPARQRPSTQRSPAAHCESVRHEAAGTDGSHPAAVSKQAIETKVRVILPDLR